MSDSAKSGCWPLSLPVLNDELHGLEGKTIVALLHLHNRLHRRLTETLAVHGLTLAQFDVLIALWNGEGITQQELASRLLVTKGNVCGLIDRMSVAGWVERRADSEDRRINRLHLTEEGCHLLDLALPGQIALGQQFCGPLTSAELATLCHLLERLDASSD
jgi:MarR family transcriptional regulator, organic hydroperoxide resistance regulator